MERRNTEPAGKRGKLQHSRLEEELERIKEDHSAVTKYCEKMRQEERASHNHNESFKNAIQSHYLSVKAVPVIGLSILEDLEKNEKISQPSQPANATFDSH